MNSIPIEFEELKNSGELPSPAGVGMKILEITRTDDYSAEDMGDAIMSDPSLTGRILRLSNRADRAGHEVVTTVSGAIMRLGSSLVRDLALAFSLISEREAGACRPFDYERYWSLSLGRAVAAQELSRHFGIFKPEEAYICGLLGEVGMLALASVHAERYGKILMQNQGLSLRALREAEFVEFEIDHATVSKCMLSEWGLPTVFVEAVTQFNTQREFEPGGEPISSLSDLLRLSDAIGSAILMGETTPPRRITEIGDQLEILKDVLEVDDSGLQSFCDRVSKEWQQWGESLDIQTSDVRFSQVLAAIAHGRQVAREQGAGNTATAVAPSPKVASPVPHALKTPKAKLPPLGVSMGDERIHILAVDDDPVSLRLLVRHLRAERFEVSMARGGKEALKKALQEKPALMIVDHEMPDLNGLEVVKALRRSSVGASMYILLLTGSHTNELLVEAFDAGVDDFVTKPFLATALSARIKAGVRIAKLQAKVERDRKTILEQLADKSALNRKLRTASLTDPLTGLPNRRHAMNRVDVEWKATERNGIPFSVIMLDIDKFKAVNDTYGHDVGDEVLQSTALAVKSALRGEDEVCRLGGEEFLVICRGAFEKDGAIVAERIRKAVESNVIDTPGFGRAITVSLGVAGTHSGVSCLMALMKASDEALYQAKNEGRNCTRLAGAPMPTPEEQQKLQRAG
ncbi:MAG: diguanylate cyclase (GGDEF)-like protein [Planctomycetota bacterium]|jgi:two-component system cell cycle response regulator